MQQLNKLEVIFSLFLVFSVIPFVFAENPTPYNEWDFDFMEIEISQNPNNLRELIITSEIFFKGDMRLGSVNLEVMVTNPDGTSDMHVGRINDMKDGTTRQISWERPLLSEGEYVIELVMKNTSLEYDPNHVFDQEIITYHIEPFGFEKSLDSVAEDTDEAIFYMLGNGQHIQNFERMHIIFTLPDLHTFDKIWVTNGQFVQDYPVATEELYLHSETGYSEMKVYLVKEGNWLPMADAQSEIMDYVLFFSIHKNVCYSVDCNGIDYEGSIIEEPEKENDGIDAGLAMIIASIISAMAGGSFWKYLKRPKIFKGN